MREAAFKHLNALRAALPDEHHVFAAGDFNTTSAEDAREGLFEKYSRPAWEIAHDFPCDGCAGTYYYRPDDSWSFLDTILFSPARGKNATAHLRTDSVSIANSNPAHVSSTGTPERFDADGRTGVSDHWPMTVIIDFAQKQ
jgi:hypothetical protein